MSLHEKLYGTLEFSKTGYSQIVRDVRKQYNLYIKKLQERSLDLHEILKDSMPNTLAVKKQRADYFIQRSIITLPHVRNDLASTRQDTQKLKEELFRGKNGGFTKPRMSSFPTLTNKTRTFTIQCDEGYFQFTENADGTGTCRIAIPYNNHSVDRAFETGTYKAVATALHNYKWKRNEGGAFYYESEQDADDESGFKLPEINQVFGPLGKDAVKNRNDAFASYCR